MKIKIKNLVAMTSVLFNTKDGTYIQWEYDEERNVYDFLKDKLLIAEFSADTELQFNMTQANSGVLLVPTVLGLLELRPFMEVDTSVYLAQEKDCPILTPDMINDIKDKLTVTYIEQTEPYQVMHCNVALGSFILGTAFSKAALPGNYSKEDGYFYSRKNAMENANACIYQMEAYFMTKLFDNLV